MATREPSDDSETARPDAASRTGRRANGTASSSNSNVRTKPRSKSRLIS